MLIAALATVSRTGATMLIAEGLMLLALRPRAIFRLWPWFLPLVVVIHFAAPQALGGLKSAFMPQGGIVAEQKGAGAPGAHNRLGQVGPSIDEWSHHPAFGVGFSTRIVDANDPNKNAMVLDDQWLGTLLETGAVGLLSLIWLFGRSIRMAVTASSRARSRLGGLLAALAASIAGFFVGMLTFDAFGFFQCTFLVFVLIGLTVAVRRVARAEAAGATV
jgi:hypothetical protein